MDFSLSNEHAMMQKMVRGFAQKEVAPVIKEYDRKQEPIPWECDLPAYDETAWQS